MRGCVCLAVMVLGCAAAAAQAPTPDAPVPAPPNPVSPNPGVHSPTAPSPDASGAAEKRNSAAKLAGLAGFVNMSCEAIRTDTDRLTSAVRAFGVEMKDLEQGEMRLRAQSYIDAYRKDVASSCLRADEMFGRSGTVIPNLFVAR